MRLVIVAFLSLIAASCHPAYAQELLYDGNQGVVRILNAPCPVAIVSSQPQGERGYFRLARVFMAGVEHAACAAPMRVQGRMLMHLIYEDGDQGFLEFKDFRPAPPGL